MERVSKEKIISMVRLPRVYKTLNIDSEESYLLTKWCSESKDVIVFSEACFLSIYFVNTFPIRSASQLLCCHFACHRNLWDWFLRIWSALLSHWLNLILVAFHASCTPLLCYTFFEPSFFHRLSLFWGWLFKVNLSGTHLKAVNKIGFRVFFILIRWLWNFLFLKNKKLFHSDVAKSQKEF